jgi:hypothetical protein
MKLDDAVNNWNRKQKPARDKAHAEAARTAAVHAEAARKLEIASLWAKTIEASNQSRKVY